MKPLRTPLNPVAEERANEALRAELEDLRDEEDRRALADEKAPWDFPELRELP